MRHDLARNHQPITPARLPAEQFSGCHRVRIQLPQPIERLIGGFVASELRREPVFPVAGLVTHDLDPGVTSQPVQHAQRRANLQPNPMKTLACNVQALAFQKSHRLASREKNSDCRPASTRLPGTPHDLVINLLIVRMRDRRTVQRTPPQLDRIVSPRILDALPQFTRDIKESRQAVHPINPVADRPPILR
jgi:hypothetical protein